MRTDFIQLKNGNGISVEYDECVWQNDFVHYSAAGITILSVALSEILYAKTTMPKA